MKFLNFLLKSKYYAISLFLIISLIFSSNNIFADYMQSNSYRMQSDSLNFGGLESNSGNYKLNDTLGEIATGDSNSASYKMHAGFWQMQSSFISISDPTDLVMTSMAGLSGGSSEGTMSWTVLTDNKAGYSMTIAASTTPALKSAQDSLDDYTPAGSDPDFNFSIPSTTSAFGFSPEGSEALPRYRDNGFACNTGSSETTGKCWDGLSVTPKAIAGSSTSNMPSGSNITVRFRAESGADHIQSSGQYSVNIIATATTL